MPSLVGHPNPFRSSKPIIAMLHLSGDTREEKLTIARREVEAFIEGGADGIMVEDYFGDQVDVENALEWLSGQPNAPVIGVNVLRDFRTSFELCGRYPVQIVQIDSVAGHLPPEEDAMFARDLAKLRERHGVLVFGGVRFKYQPVRSGRSLEEDLRLGMERCDAIVVTGDATGEETDEAKIASFRDIVGDFPLIVGAGVTVGNAATQLALVDGAIVGSYFKDTYRDTGIVDVQHVCDLMHVVREIRDGIALEAEGKVQA